MKQKKGGKSAIVKDVMKKGLTSRKAEKAVNAVFDCMKFALWTGEPVEIPGGTIQSKIRKGRPRAMKRYFGNVQTGETKDKIISYPGWRRVVKFTPDKTLDLTPPPSSGTLDLKMASSGGHGAGKAAKLAAAVRRILRSRVPEDGKAPFQRRPAKVVPSWQLASVPPPPMTSEEIEVRQLASELLCQPVDNSMIATLQNAVDVRPHKPGALLRRLQFIQSRGWSFISVYSLAQQITEHYWV